MLRIAFVFTVLILAARLNAAAADDGLAHPPIHFGRQILPVFSEHCFQCHGPDVKQRQADLRLDEEASAKQARDGGAAIVPGKSDASELYRRIVSPDPDERMPPEDVNRPLSAEQIALVKRWIDEGAPWGGHWALERIARPPVAKSNAFADRCENAIDGFVVARLVREGLSPASEASRETLIRRLSLDLIGLPPTPDEVDAFVADSW